MKTMLIIAAMILGQLAFGTDQVSNNTREENQFDIESITLLDQADAAKMSEACKALKLTPEQMQSYTDAKYLYQKASIQLNANLKLAKLDYMKNVMSDAGTEAIALTVSTDSIKIATDLLTEKLNFVNKVLFKILDVPQRKLAVACMADMKKMHRKQRGGGHHAGGHGELVK